MKSVVRCFIAVDVGPGIRREVEKTVRRLSGEAPQVKWTAPDRFHLTLKFLGDVPMTELHRVIRAVEKAALEVEPFDLFFEGLDAFPSAKNPRTLWVGATDGVGEARELVSRLETEFSALGYPREIRPFTPHLTIGRLGSEKRKHREHDNLPPDEKVAESPGASLADLLVAERETFFGTSPVDSLLVFSSELSRQGPKYEVLAEVELKNSRGYTGPI